MRTDTTHDYAEPWDKADVKTLRKLLRKRWTHQAIADHMGRSLDAVRSKVYRLKRNA